MDEVVDTAKSVPFSNKVSLEKDAIFAVIDDIRAIVFDMRKGLPHEISQARRVLGDKDNHISEARNKADLILKAADAEAAKRVAESQITVQAKIKADEIFDDAKRDVNEFKTSAAQYVDGVFKDLDEMMRAAMDDYMIKSREIEGFYKDIMAELYHNRKEIRIDSDV